MKTILKGWPLGLAAVLLSSLVQAQPPKSSPEERAGRLTEWMQQHLQLTETQRPPVEQINLTYAHRTEALLRGHESRLSRLRAARSLQEAKDQELKRVLSPQQLQLYQQQRKTWRDELRKAGGTRR